MANCDRDEPPSVPSSIETPEADEAERRVHEARRLLAEVEERAAEMRAQLHALGRDVVNTHVSPSADTIAYPGEDDSCKRTPFSHGYAVHSQSHENGRADPTVVLAHHAPSHDAGNNGHHRSQMVGARLNFKPDPYDGISDFTEYMVYFEQLSEMQNWDHPTMAMALGLCLKGSARSVLANLTLAQRREYKALKSALMQHFCPPQKVHLYRAELKVLVKVYRIWAGM